MVPGLTRPREHIQDDGFAAPERGSLVLPSARHTVRMGRSLPARPSRDVLLIRAEQFDPMGRDGLSRVGSQTRQPAAWLG